LTNVHNFRKKGAFFLSEDGQKKPGYPLQSFCLRQKGFPLLSLAPRSERICERKFAANQDAWASSKIAYARLRPAPVRDSGPVYASHTQGRCP
jgi:hypothetical protein